MVEDNWQTKSEKFSLSGAMFSAFRSSYICRWIGFFILIIELGFRQGRGCRDGIPVSSFVRFYIYGQNDVNRPLPCFFIWQ